MYSFSGILEIAHHMAAIIDPPELGTGSAREIDLSENSVIHEKTMGDASGVQETAHDLTAIID